MLYSFKDHVAELREREDQCLTNYEKYVEDLSGISNLEDTEMYKSYLSKFSAQNLVESIPLTVPEALVDDFDYPLLLQLVCASFSSDYKFELSSDLNSFRLGISVSAGEQTAFKYLDDLWSYVIFRLFEIFVEEQMGICALAHILDRDMTELKECSRAKINRFKAGSNALKSEKINKALLMDSLI